MKTDVEFRTMELHFTITPAHTQIRLAELLEHVMLKHDRQLSNMQGHANRLQDRLLAPFLFALCLVAGALALYFPDHHLTAGKVISLVLFGLILVPLWWFGSGRLLRYLRTRIAAKRGKPRATFRGVNQRLIESRLRTSLKTTEGDYCLQFDDQGFTVIRLRASRAG
ncbi:hypothetical protein ACYZT9_12535 [Pseudomonas sp. ZT5P21]